MLRINTKKPLRCDCEEENFGARTIKQFFLDRIEPLKGHLQEHAEKLRGPLRHVAILENRWRDGRIFQRHKQSINSNYNNCTICRRSSENELPWEEAGQFGNEPNYWNCYRVQPTSKLVVYWDQNISWLKP